VGRTRGAKTFPLRNQSLALESLKDQLGFLVTIILGGDSFFHQTKTPTSIPATRKDCRDVELSRGYDIQYTKSVPKTSQPHVAVVVKSKKDVKSTVSPAVCKQTKLVCLMNILIQQLETGI
jgi:hypothetical protein